MNLYPAVRCFLREALSGSTMVTKEMDSFLKLCIVCDLLKDVVRCKHEDQIPVLADKIGSAVSEYLAAVKTAYGVDCMRFKHHQLMHVAGQVRRDLLLLSCWTLERKHISSKQCFAHYRHSELMPGGALSRMVNKQVPKTSCMGAWCAWRRGPLGLHA